MWISIQGVVVNMDQVASVKFDDSTASASVRLSSYNPMDDEHHQEGITRFEVHGTDVGRLRDALKQRGFPPAP